MFAGHCTIVCSRADFVMNALPADAATLPAFFEDLKNNPGLAERWNGLRQDSGDPFEFIHVAIKLYQDLGIDPSTSEP